MTGRTIQTFCVDGRTAIFNSEHVTRIEEFKYQIDPKTAGSGATSARVHFDDGGSIELPMHPVAAAGLIWGEDGS